MGHLKRGFLMFRSQAALMITQIIRIRSLMAFPCGVTQNDSIFTGGSE